MPSTTAESVSTETQRAELQAVLQSPLFSRSPALVRLLSYLCEKALAGESANIKEFSVAVDVFGRDESFDQDSDSIVRVEANRLRKRLAEYYAGEGAAHRIHITIPVGKYVPVFEEHESEVLPEAAQAVPIPAPLSRTESNKLGALATPGGAGGDCYRRRSHVSDPAANATPGRDCAFCSAADGFTSHCGSAGRRRSPHPGRVQPSLR